MCQRVLRGIEVTDETLATDLIIEHGPEDHFAAEMHTVEHMREEFFVPKLSNRDKRDVMAPESDALSRARDFVAAVRGDLPQGMLPETVRDALLNRFPGILQLGGTQAISQAAANA
jgi:trimethylamine--corrinoid protein Co-methyltransferase